MKRLIILSSFAITFLAGCFADEVKLKNDSYQVELGESISTDPVTYLDKRNSKDIRKDAKITFKKDNRYVLDKERKILKSTNDTYVPVGTYRGTLSYKKTKKTFNVYVKDTKAPVFITFKKEIRIEVNAQGVDLAKYFEAKDFSDISTSIEEGTLDLSKEGTYKVEVIVIDTYKNKVTKSSNITIVSGEDAKRNGVSAMVDGTIPKSKETQQRETEIQAPQNPTTQTQGGGGGYAPPSTDDAYSGSGSSTCVPNGSFGRLGNSGRFFYSEAEADTWAQSQWLDENSPYYLMGYYALTVIDSCGEERNDVWTIDWY